MKLSQLLYFLKCLHRMTLNVELNIYKGISSVYTALTKNFKSLGIENFTLNSFVWCSLSFRIIFFIACYRCRSRRPPSPPQWYGVLLLPRHWQPDSGSLMATRWSTYQQPATFSSRRRTSGRQRAAPRRASYTWRRPVRMPRRERCRQAGVGHGTAGCNSRRSIR